MIFLNLKSHLLQAGAGIFTSATAGILAAMAQPAHAVQGFSLPFDPQSWVLAVNGGDPLTQSCDPEFPFPCVNANPNQAVIGAGDNTGSESPKVVTWTWHNPSNSLAYFISFDLACLECNVANGYAYFKVGDNQPSSSISTTDEAVSSNSQILAPGKDITFYLVSNDFAPTFAVTVNNFSANPVPAPLPAAGAATAFGYTRRLRRRIQQPRHSGSCPPILPPPPSAYLNLAPATLRSLPISFSYPAQPVRTEASKRGA